MSAANPADPLAYAKHCIRLARGYFHTDVQEGDGHDRLPQEHYLALRDAVRDRPAHAGALELWNVAQAGLDLLLHAERKAGFAERLASTFAFMGILAQSLEDMQPGGVIDHARAAASAQAQREAAAKAGAEASRNKAWHEEAQRIWAEQPDAKLNKVAAEIARKFSTSAHLVDKSSVMRSIRALVPPTSPSFKTG